MTKFRNNLLDTLYKLYTRSRRLQVISEYAHMQTDHVSSISDKKLAEWLIDNQFEEGGRFEETLVDVQVSLDELRQLLTMYKEGEKGGKTA